jgi:hypothetical protein
MTKKVLFTIFMFSSLIHSHSKYFSVTKIIVYMHIRHTLTQLVFSFNKERGRGNTTYCDCEFSLALSRAQIRHGRAHVIQICAIFYTPRKE